jgi:hypothetical protein
VSEQTSEEPPRAESPPSDAPAGPTAEATVEASDDAPAEAPTETTVEPTSSPATIAPTVHERPVPTPPPRRPIATPPEPAADVPAAPAVDEPAPPAADAPAEPAVEALAEPPAEPPTEPALETPAEPVVGAPAPPTADVPPETTVDVPATPTPATVASTVHEHPVPAPPASGHSGGAPASTWGRVADDGTVFVRTAEGERSVGSSPGAAHDEALTYFGRKYDELEGQVALLEQRLAAGGVAPKDAATSIGHLREAVTDAHAVGDLDGLLARLAVLDGLVAERR